MKRVCLAVTCAWLCWNVATMTFAIRHESRDGKKEAVVATRASGTFDVKLAPLAGEDLKDGASLGRMSIDKQFQGDLKARPRARC